VAARNKKTTSAKRKSSAGKKPMATKWKAVAAFLFLLLLLSPFYYGYVIKTFSAGWRWFKDLGGNPNYRTYKSFHIRIPSNYKIHGIDVSSYQGRIDWQRVKTMQEDSVHIGFAFIKATEGILKVDPYFQRNWRECNKAGITCGAYQYFRPKFSGKWQADLFLQTVKLQKGNLPLVVDVERLDGMKPEKMRQELDDFIKVIILKTKITPIIYTGLTFYQENLAGFYDDCPLWISSFDHPVLTISAKTNWKFWQHSEKAKVNGIVSVVDFDLFRGDSLAFQKMLIK
jgi:lysozyme